METILVTGGAGYIGSHTVRALLREGYNVVIVDNLSKGHKESVPKGVKLIVADLKDKAKLGPIFDKYNFKGVLHFAASIEVGESMEYPFKYYGNNTVNSMNLFELMIEKGVKNIVFSSTAAVFGTPKKVPVREDALKNPDSVYGRSKLLVEYILDDLDLCKGFRSVCLRYFNASGAAFGIGGNYEPESHLIPLVLDVALGKRRDIKIFGDDYPTKDGTCIRDYIHVEDLANAHILALKALFREKKSRKFNLGSGKGYSVKEIIELSEEITGSKISAKVTKRRPGDPSTLIADSTLIKSELGWKVGHDLRSIISSQWEWQSKHPNGFSS